DIEMLKNVQPEDIEDISERFLPMWQEGRDSDTVKKIKLDGESLYLIAIIEHQSDVFYDMAFKILRYMVMVLTDYEAEQEKLHPNITKTKEFKYPPILPIVYYEGTENWTAVKNFKERVHLSDVFEKYIPDFEYLLVPVTSYSDQELIERNDEFSLIMLLNKLRSSADFKKLKDIPPEYFENLTQNTPEYLLNLISKIVAVFLYRLNIPREEVEQFTDQIGRRNFGMMFDSFEAYDVQETRRISRAEGEAKGTVKKIIAQTLKKLAKNLSVPEIADMLEENESLIQRICDIKIAHPDSNEEEIWALLCEEQERA
ncbi:MAG: Rpn family recombination-promoting nuclease/putative transposase, partial [Roseburia sp.]|nr:Rpn family recombination-promoting nuclease/putative transposase [Roseburia sp.]